MKIYAVGNISAAILLYSILYNVNDRQPSQRAVFYHNRTFPPPK